MKTRILIIIAISIAFTATLSYAIFYSSTTVFVSCDPMYEHIDGKCVLMKLKHSTACDSVKKLHDYPWHCPAITTPTKLTKLMSTGFDICDVDGDEYYVLSKGQTGTITYEVYRGFDLNDPPVADEQVELIKDNTSFISQPKEGIRQSFLPNGVSVTYDPKSLMLGFNQSAIITATISVDDDAQNDTFWLGLSPYTCFGGWHQKFAVMGD